MQKSLVLSRILDWLVKIIAGKMTILMEEFDNTDDWFEWICNELDCTEEILKKFGIDREKLYI